jgi:hypothetical protein
MPLGPSRRRGATRVARFAESTAGVRAICARLHRLRARPPSTSSPAGGTRPAWWEDIMPEPFPIRSNGAPPDVRRRKGRAHVTAGRGQVGV